MARKYVNISRDTGEASFLGVTAEVQDYTLRFREKIGTYTPPGGKGARVQMVTHVTRLEVPVEILVGDETVKITRSVEVRFHVEMGADTAAAGLLTEALRTDGMARSEYYALKGVTPPSEANFTDA